jgi:hypothetical protein
VEKCEPMQNVMSNTEQSRTELIVDAIARAYNVDIDKVHSLHTLIVETNDWITEGIVDTVKYKGFLEARKSRAERYDDNCNIFPNTLLDKVEELIRNNFLDLSVRHEIGEGYYASISEKLAHFICDRLRITDRSVNRESETMKGLFRYIKNIDELFGGHIDPSDRNSFYMFNIFDHIFDHWEPSFLPQSLNIDPTTQKNLIRTMIFAIAKNIEPEQIYQECWADFLLMMQEEEEEEEPPQEQDDENNEQGEDEHQQQQGHERYADINEIFGIIDANREKLSCAEYIKLMNCLKRLHDKI